MAGVSGTDERHRLTALTGTVGLGLDALASVAYGPEVIVLILAGAGSAGLRLMLPVTVVIVLLLVVLVACYRRVIAAYPDGGGAHAGIAGHHDRLRRCAVGAGGVRQRVFRADRGGSDRETPRHPSGARDRPGPSARKPPWAWYSACFSSGWPLWCNGSTPDRSTAAACSRW